MRSGYTLVELLVYMGIMAVFLMVLTQIFTSTLDVQLESSGHSAVDQTKTFLLSRLQYDIHSASSITTPAFPGQSGSVLALNIAGHSHTYQVTDSRLTVTNNTGTHLLTDVTTEVTDFTVTRIGNGTANDTITLNLGLRSVVVNSAGEIETRRLQTTFGLR